MHWRKKSVPVRELIDLPPAWSTFFPAQIAGCRARHEEAFESFGDDRCKISTRALVLIEAKSRLNDTRVTLECSAQVPILCDEVEIEQVLVNLIGNAIDAVKDLKDKWVSSLFLKLEPRSFCA